MLPVPPAIVYTSSSIFFRALYLQGGGHDRHLMHVIAGLQGSPSTPRPKMRDVSGLGPAMNCNSRGAVEVSNMSEAASFSLMAPTLSLLLASHSAAVLPGLALATVLLHTGESGALYVPSPPAEASMAPSGWAWLSGSPVNVPRTVHIRSRYLSHYLCATAYRTATAVISARCTIAYEAIVQGRKSQQRVQGCAKRQSCAQDEIGD